MAWGKYRERTGTACSSRSGGAVAARGRRGRLSHRNCLRAGADAANVEAVRRIFAIKGRPAGHPLIVHIGQAAQLDHWVREVPDQAWRLAERFWPGPLTLILARRAHVPDVVTGGQDSVGLRVPDHPPSTGFRWKRHPGRVPGTLWPTAFAAPAGRRRHEILKNVQKSGKVKNERTSESRRCHG